MAHCLKGESPRRRADKQACDSTGWQVESWLGAFQSWEASSGDPDTGSLEGWSVTLGCLEGGGLTPAHSGVRVRLRRGAEPLGNRTT